MKEWTHGMVQKRESMKVAQVIRKEVKKVFSKQSHKRKKCHANESKSDSDSDYSP